MCMLLDTYIVFFLHPNAQPSTAQAMSMIWTEKLQKSKTTLLNKLLLAVLATGTKERSHIGCSKKCVCEIYELVKCEGVLILFPMTLANHNSGQFLTSLKRTWPLKQVVLERGSEWGLKIIVFPHICFFVEKKQQKTLLTF